MLSESATVVSVDPDGAWVEARAKSQCGNCQARKGCGHSLLDALFVRSNRLKAYSGDGLLLKGLKAGDPVTIGVPEQAVLVGSLLLYLFPLLSMLLPAMLFSTAGAPESLVIVAAAAGFALGLVILRQRISGWLAPPRAQLLARDTGGTQSLTIRHTMQRSMQRREV